MNKVDFDVSMRLKSFQQVCFSSAWSLTTTPPYWYWLSVITFDCLEQLFNWYLEQTFPVIFHRQDMIMLTIQVINLLSFKSVYPIILQQYYFHLKSPMVTWSTLQLQPLVLFLSINACTFHNIWFQILSARLSKKSQTALTIIQKFFERFFCTFNRVQHHIQCCVKIVTHCSS